MYLFIVRRSQTQRKSQSVDLTLLIPTQNSTHPKHVRSSPVHARSFSPEAKHTHLDTHVPVGQTLWLRVGKVVCETNIPTNNQTKRPHHPRGCHGPSSSGWYKNNPTSWRSVRAVISPQTGATDDARGTLRSPLILQPLDIKEKLSSFWSAATISVITAFPD